MSWGEWIVLWAIAAPLSFGLGVAVFHIIDRLFPDRPARPK